MPDQRLSGPALAAGLVEPAEQWRWSGLRGRNCGEEALNACLFLASATSQGLDRSGECAAKREGTPARASEPRSGPTIRRSERIERTARGVLARHTFFAEPRFVLVARWVLSRQAAGQGGQS